MKLAAITFPVYIHSATDFLDGKYKTRIAEIDFTILTPRLPEGELDGRDDLIAPNKGKWSSIRHWGLMARNHVLIGGLGASLDADIHKKDMERVHQEIPHWIEMIHDWLRVLNGNLVEFAESASAEMTWMSEKVTQSEQYTGPTRHLNSPSVASRDQWAYTLKQVGNGIEPPLAHTLLVSSKNAIEISNWRGALIDAVTCTEVAMASGLRADLDARLPVGTADVIVKEMRGLASMLKVARKLGLALPANPSVDLLMPRNSVVHNGIKASETQARLAVEVAQEVVDRYAPLPDDCPTST